MLLLGWAAPAPGQSVGISNPSHGELLRIVLFDGRFDGGLNPQFGGTSVDEAMYVQMPASGLDALEETHHSSLPHPGLVEFNQVLHDKAIGTELEIATETGPSKSDKACIPLTDTGLIRARTPSTPARLTRRGARAPSWSPCHHASGRSP
jgi:hypothetical protein